jgi:hypothetical protein
VIGNFRISAQNATIIVPMVRRNWSLCYLPVSGGSVIPFDDTPIAQTQQSTKNKRMKMMEKMIQKTLTLLGVINHLHVRVGNLCSTCSSA